jgi:hypothetical protein
MYAGIWKAGVERYFWKIKRTRISTIVILYIADGLLGEIYRKLVTHPKFRKEIYELQIFSKYSAIKDNEESIRATINAKMP